MIRQPHFTHLGTLALDYLTPGRRGQVLAAFSQAVYLLTDSGGLFWVVDGSAPMHRRCAAISGRLPALTAGSPFHVEARRLTVEPGHFFDLDAASIWRAPRLERWESLELDLLHNRLHAFFSGLDLSRARGFGGFIPAILCLSQNVPFRAPGETDDPILRAAWPSVLSLARACLGRDLSNLASDATALIGLGTGLTPSGDDFLGGLLFAMRALGIAIPDPDFAVAGLAVENFRPRTNVISFTLLQDLAAGHAVAPLHQIVNGLLGRAPVESIYPSVSQLTRLGGSTGWDLLTGLLTGLLSGHRSAHLASAFGPAAFVAA